MYIETQPRITFTAKEEKELRAVYNMTNELLNIRDYDEELWDAVLNLRDGIEILLARSTVEESP